MDSTLCSWCEEGRAMNVVHQTYSFGITWGFQVNTEGGPGPLGTENSIESGSLRGGTYLPSGSRATGGFLCTAGGLVLA